MPPLCPEYLYPPLGIIPDWDSNGGIGIVRRHFCFVILSKVPLGALLGQDGIALRHSLLALLCLQSGTPNLGAQVVHLHSTCNAINKLVVFTHMRCNFLISQSDNQSYRRGC